MEWHKWSGFSGEGTYVILNKGSLTSLDLLHGSSNPGTKAQGFLHSPNNGAQVWRLFKDAKADAYAIENVRAGLVLTATGIEKEIVGTESPSPNRFLHKKILEYPSEALWAIDSSLYSLEAGKMVLFRSMKYPGYLMDLHNGETANGTPVRLFQERGVCDEREMQKWLLQRQGDEWVEAALALQA